METEGCRKFILLVAALLVSLYLMKPQLCAVGEVQSKKVYAMRMLQGEKDLEARQSEVQRLKQQVQNLQREVAMQRKHLQELQIEVRHKEEQISGWRSEASSPGACLTDAKDGTTPSGLDPAATDTGLVAGERKTGSETGSSKRFNAREWFPQKALVEQMVGDREKGWCAKHSRLIGTPETGGNINGQWQQDWFAFVNFWNSPFYKHTRAPHNLHPGFFLDIGANAHKWLSNTWFLDMCLGWKGICVEANPELAANLRKFRNCEVVAKCIHPTSKKIDFNPADEHGHVQDTEVITERQAARTEQRGSITVPCTTLTAVLAKYNVTHVDFMSLDIEGSELAALSCIPWKKVTIDVIAMENVYNTIEQRWFLLGLGYTLAAQLGQDEVFVRQGSPAAARLAAAPLMYPGKANMQTGWRVQTGFLWKQKCCTNGPRGKWDAITEQWG